MICDLDVWSHLTTIQIRGEKLDVVGRAGLKRQKIIITNTTIINYCH